MTFQTAKPVARAATGTGVNARLQVRKDKSTTVTVSVTEAFQEKHFNGSIEGEFVALNYGTGADGGLLQMQIIEEGGGGIVAVKGPRGSVRLSCTGWGILGKEAQKTAPCTYVSDCETGITIRLPAWANGKEKLDAEFGLKG